MCLGRLYWSEEQVLYSDLNAMIIAAREHARLLRSIFGGAEPPPAQPPGEPLPPITPKTFMAMFARPRASRRRRKS